MSAAALGETCGHPTVLNLRPFSRNKASMEEDASKGGGHRYIPMLAFTRSCPGRSREEAAWLLRHVQRAFTERKPSLLSRRRKSGPQDPYDAAMDSYAVHRQSDNLASDVNADSEKTVSFSSSEDFSGSKHNHDLRQLLKSRSGPQGEGRFFLPHKGIWRAVTLTPGEIDLQRHRCHRITDRDVVEEVGARRSQQDQYKVNVSQLPRSSTPIHDNDPDKLNMKHVVAFLKSRGPRSKETRKQIQQKFAASVDLGLQTDAGAEKDPFSRSNRGNPFYLPTAPQYRIPSRGVKSNSIVRDRKPAQSCPTTRRTVGSTRDAVAKRLSLREEAQTWLGESLEDMAVRQFRLHRFLASCQQAPESSVAADVKSSVPPDQQPAAFVDICKSRSAEGTAADGNCVFIPPPEVHGGKYSEKWKRRQSPRRSDGSDEWRREPKTQQLVQNKSHMRNKPKPALKSAPPAASVRSVIRLPSSGDALSDHDIGLHGGTKLETESEVTDNSSRSSDVEVELNWRSGSDGRFDRSLTNRERPLSEVTSVNTTSSEMCFTQPFKTLALADRPELSTEKENDAPISFGISPARMEIHSSSFTSAESRVVHVTMPQEWTANETSQDPRSVSDVIRLTLRKERVRTREKTYLSDLEDNGREAVAKSSLPAMSLGDYVGHWPVTKQQNWHGSVDYPKII